MNLQRIAAAFSFLALAVAVTPGVLAQDKVLRVVPHSNLAILDPIWTTAYMSRNHGYMIYDTLFGTDEKAQVKPQMVEEWTASADRRLWTFKLRKDLEFHDGKAVTGLLSWNSRPSRSVKVHVFLSGLTVNFSSICGLTTPFSSIANSVS